MKNEPYIRGQWETWFNRVRGEFSRAALPLAGKPITYVEVGCWAGAASEWMCRNVLTSPDSRAYGIDPYIQSEMRRRHPAEAIKAEAADRVREVVGDRWRWLYEKSSAGLRRLRGTIGDDSIDLLYLDGIHEAYGVVQDFVLAWPMLKVGSVVIFDDIKKTKTPTGPHVKEAFAAITSTFSLLVEPHKGRRQAWLKVLAKNEPGKPVYL